MPTWTENVSRSSNAIIKQFAGRAGKIRGYGSYNRWIKETTGLRTDLNVQQVGELYGTKNIINTSKKALAHNKTIFQIYSDLLRRKNSRQTNVQELAAFVAIVVMTQIPITCEARHSPAAAPVAAPAPTEKVATTAPTTTEVEVEEEEEEEDKAANSFSLGDGGTGLDDWENGDW